MLKDTHAHVGNSSIIVKVLKVSGLFPKNYNSSLFLNDNNIYKKNRLDNLMATQKVTLEFLKRQPFKPDNIPIMDVN